MIFSAAVHRSYRLNGNAIFRPSIRVALTHGCQQIVYSYYMDHTGCHQLNRAFTATKNSCEIANPTVNLIPFDLIRQLEGRLHAVLRVSLRCELGELLQAREEPRHGSVVLVAAEDVDGAVQLVRVAPRVHHFGEASEGLQGVRLEPQLARLRQGVAVQDVNLKTKF
jgi:hypothetical protein